MNNDDNPERIKTLYTKTENLALLITDAYRVLFEVSADKLTEKYGGFRSDRFREDAEGGIVDLTESEVSKALSGILSFTKGDIAKRLQKEHKERGRMHSEQLAKDLEDKYKDRYYELKKLAEKKRKTKDAELRRSCLDFFKSHPVVYTKWGPSDIRRYEKTELDILDSVLQRPSSYPSKVLKDWVNVLRTTPMKSWVRKKTLSRVPYASGYLVVTEAKVKVRRDATVIEISQKEVLSEKWRKHGDFQLKLAPFMP
jgi:hypothetical protein